MKLRYYFPKRLRSGRLYPSFLEEIRRGEYRFDAERNVLYVSLSPSPSIRTGSKE